MASRKVEHHENSSVLSVEQLADYLGVVRSKAYEIVRSEPGFPAVRLGKIIRIPRDLLDDWLRRQVGLTEER